MRPGKEENHQIPTSVHVYKHEGGFHPKLSSRLTWSEKDDCCPEFRGIASHFLTANDCPVSSHTSLGWSCVVIRSSQQIRKDTMCSSTEKDLILLVHESVGCQMDDGRPREEFHMDPEEHHQHCFAPDALDIVHDMSLHHIPC